jgi:hypothetical protein
MKKYLLYIGIFIMGLVVGSALNSGNSAVKSTENQVAASVPTASPVNLTGTGQQATEKFRLNKGLVVFEMNHKGTSNFAVKLLESDGKYHTLLVNVMGDFQGSKAVEIKKTGDYILDVSASGEWSVKTR